MYWRRAAHGASRSAPPGVEVLDDDAPTDGTPPASTEEQRARGQRLEEALHAFGVTGAVVAQEAGPVVTRYAWLPPLGVKLSKLVNLQADLALTLAVDGVRVAPIPASNTIGIEVPNRARALVPLRDVVPPGVEPDAATALRLALGVDIRGEPVRPDLCQLPHLLVAGTTGSGKSVGLHAMLCALLLQHTPRTLRLILIDPKRLELTRYAGVPHLLHEVVTDPSIAHGVLETVLREDIAGRYALLSQRGAQDVTQYNAMAGVLPLHRLLIVIDELADLMVTAPRGFAKALQRLVQLSRAAGIYVIAATQRPSVDIVQGVLKANFPARLTYRLASTIDSHTILGMKGAETLLAYGDALFVAPGAKPVRVHGPWLSGTQITNVVQAWR